MVIIGAYGCLLNFTHLVCSPLCIFPFYFCYLFYFALTLAPKRERRCQSSWTQQEISASSLFSLSGGTRAAFSYLSRFICLCRRFDTCARYMRSSNKSQKKKKSHLHVSNKLVLIWIFGGRKREDGYSEGEAKTTEERDEFGGWDESACNGWEAERWGRGEKCHMCTCLTGEEVGEGEEVTGVKRCWMWWQDSVTMKINRPVCKSVLSASALIKALHEHNNTRMFSRCVNITTIYIFNPFILLCFLGNRRQVPEKGILNTPSKVK